MFTQFVLIAALMLPCHAFATARAQESGAAPQEARLMEEQIGLTLFQPRHTGARELRGYAKDLTESNIQFVVANPATGQLDIRQRDRFVVVAESIAVQGDEASRKKGVDFLRELDEFFGKNRAEKVQETQLLVRTVRLRSMGVNSALHLLHSMAENVEAQVVAEAGTIVLRGGGEAVSRAEALLLEVDKPAPQMTLHVTLVEMIDGAPQQPVGGQLGDALGKLMPGKQPERVGAFMLRASVAGSTPIELSSGFGGNEEIAARFSMVARSRSWDAERRVLTLGSCEVRSERPRFTTMVTKVVAGVLSDGQPAPKQVESQEVLAGIDKEGFTTDLSLNLGQDTVVGSLGGNALLVVLRFTVD